MLNYAAPPSPTSQGAGVAAAGQQAWQWLQDQRVESVRQGLLDPDTGLPTQKGVVQGVGQTAQGIVMGTTAPGDVPPPGIVAYHGSPADFNRFDDRFIGTGEGAQAYGRGHYFGGAEETGRNYRDALTPETIPNPEFNAAQQEYNAKYSAVGNAAGATDAEFNAAIAARDAAYEKMKSLPPTIPNPAAPGHMYEVKIGADPEHFLHWDKPLYQQSDAVKQSGIIPKTPDYQMQTGGEFLERLSRRLGGSDVAAKALQDAGIPGVRYLDQGSRGAGQGTHNYVVFDPAMIDILRKYGLAGLIAGGGAAAAATQQQQPSQ
jgi:hypothetical protein